MLRALELYCGIGGFSAAVGEAVEVMASYDIHRGALEAVRQNFSHPVIVRALDSVPEEELAAWGADLWWLSPPCQPFTRRGLFRDDEDPRSRSLLRLGEVIRAVCPPLVALENVPGMEGSRTHRRLADALDGAGYHLWQGVICPSDLGMPNRRRRFYLLASRAGAVAPRPPAETARRPLSTFLHPDPEAYGELTVGAELLERYQGALDLVDRGDPQAVTACFTSAYGRSPVRSGSYLVCGERVRRFAPQEILRLLGFPARYSLPPSLSCDQGWRLVGNSLALTAVRWLLAAIPGLENLVADEGEGPINALP